METSSTSTSTSKGYRMSDTKYGVYYKSPIQQHPKESFMAAVGTSGSPSYCWALLRAHLGFEKGTITNKELGERGYRVGVVPKPVPLINKGSREYESESGVKGQQGVGRIHYVDRVADLERVDTPLTYERELRDPPYPDAKDGPDWPFWIGLATVIAVGAFVGWLVG